MPFSRRSSQPSDPTHTSYVSCTGRCILYHWCHLGSHHSCLSAAEKGVIFVMELSQIKDSKVLRMGPDHLMVSKCPHGNYRVSGGILQMLLSSCGGSKDFRARMLQCMSSHALIRYLEPRLCVWAVPADKGDLSIAD